jgi:ferric-dicitrate binding protein FerR (iron transport regulator)
MKPESEVVVDTPPEKDSKLKLLAGNIWVNVKKMIKDGTMEVHAGQAVAGIKGTIFVLEEINNTTTLKVIEGVVAFKSLATNEEKLVKTGEVLTATSSGLDELKQFDVTTESASWDKKTDSTIDDTDFATTQETKSTNYKIPVLATILAFAVFALVLVKTRKKT